MKNLFSLSFFAVMFSVTGASSEAHADELIHRGFMVRGGLGVGYISTSETVGTESINISGSTAALHLALGGYVAPNFALHATIWGGVAVNPSLSLGSRSISTSNVSLTSTALGIGVTYFIRPNDIFLSASVGFGILSVERSTFAGTLRGKTNAGLSLNLMAGKQFAVTDTFGIGGALQAGWQNNSDDVGFGLTETLSTLQIGLLLTLSYH
jgi:hypothetical protein